MEKIPIKQIGLVLPLVAASFLFGLSLRLPGDLLEFVFSVRWLLYLLEILLTITLLGLTVGVFATLNTDKRILGVGLVLSTLACTAGLAPSFSPPALGIFGLFTLGLYLAYQNVKGEMHDLVRFVPSKIYPNATNNLLVILTLAAALSVYLSSQQALSAGQIKLPRAKLDATLLPIAQMIESKLGQQLPAITGTKQNQQSLSPAGINLEKLTTVPKELASPVAEEIAQKIESLLQPYLKLLPILLAISVFLAPLPLRSVVGYLSTLFIAIAIKILRVLKFVKMETQTKEGQWPVLS